MKVCAVIVTYGDRFHLLKQVMDACYKEGVSKIIVVDNDSEQNSKIELKKYENEHKDRLKVIYLDENSGSAGGFKRGLEVAYKCNECEYILTLDDDNILQRNSLKQIANIFQYLQNIETPILAMYRSIWNDNKDVVDFGITKTQNILPNNFMAFNFTSYIKHIFNRIFTLKKNKNIYPLNPVNYNGMGGLIFHKSILNNVGFPEEIFYLYTDDIEYTYRMTENGYKIFLCSEILIEDIDKTYSDSLGNEISYFHPEFSEFKMYYLLRNRAYFSKKFISNKFIFYANGMILLLLFFKNIFKTPPKLFIKRYKLFIKAVYDGLNDKMGKVY
jgi:GT2 family glycosyltransferase